MTKLADNATPKQDAFALVSKNFCNFPIARDARHQLDWRQSEKTGRWVATLSAQPGRAIQLRLPKDVAVEHKRPPTAFDINVLLLLLTEAKLRGTQTITIRSRSALLRALGLGADAANLRRLEQALDYWSVVSLGFERWFFARQLDADEYRRKLKRREMIADFDDFGLPSKNKAHRGKAKLPPPFKLETGKLTIADVWWYCLGPEYCAMVPLPLPATAASQNLLLCVLAKPTDWRGIDRLSAKLGIAHSQQKRSFHRAISVMLKYIYKHGGEVEIERDGNQIRFYGVELPTPKWSSLVRAARLERQPSQPETPKPSQPEAPKEEEIRPRPRTLRIINQEEAWFEDGRPCTVYNLSDGRSLLEEELPKGLLAAYQDMLDGVARLGRGHGYAA
jgi:hypothetical protein